jgi:hypothetical protein
MAITRRVLKKLQESLPEMRLCKKVLVVAPTQRIVRGFMFERTMVKDRYFFRRVLLPLYSPTDSLHLSYSQRIPGGLKTFHPSPENVDEISDEILQVIVDGHLEELRNIRRLEDFLRVKPTHSGLATGVEMAVTHYLLGDADKCIAMLEEALAANHYPDYPHAIRATALLEDLKTNPALAAQRIESWEREHIERLGLADVMAGGMER